MSLILICIHFVNIINCDYYIYLFSVLIENSQSCCRGATEKPRSWEGWILSEHWPGRSSCAADVGGKTS